MKIEIQREDKTPEDNCVLLAPKHGNALLKAFDNKEVFVQSSNEKCS